MLMMMMIDQKLRNDILLDIPFFPLSYKALVPFILGARPDLSLPKIFKKNVCFYALGI